jgi:uncharacterized protein (DUF1778 family)
MRVSGEQEDLLRRAAAQQGESMTGFVLAAATTRAHQVIEQAQRIELGREAFARFVEALSEPVEEMPVLRRYAE